MHYNLLFNGCSFTAGGELEGLEKNFLYRDEHRFSHLIHKKTGLSYCNISKCGASNQLILDSTINWFEEGNTCDHAVIQWTHRSRRLHYEKNGWARNIQMKPKNTEFLSKSNWLNYDILRRHYVALQNDTHDQYNEDMCTYWMSLFLINKCSLYYLKLSLEYKVCDRYYENSCYHKYAPNKKISYIIPDIIPPRILDRKYYCKYKSEVYSGGHPNELGHGAIADYILNNDDYFKDKNV